MNQDIFELVCKYLDVKSVIALASTHREYRWYARNSRYVFREAVPVGFTQKAISWMHPGSTVFTHKVLKTQSPAVSVAWSPNGRDYAYHCSKSVLLCKSDDMVMQIMLNFFDYCSGHVIWSPDGTSIVIVGRDPVMHIWDVRRNPPKKTFSLARAHRFYLVHTLEF